MVCRLGVTLPLTGATLLVACLTTQAGTTWGQWRNSLKPKGKPAAELELAVGGHTEYAIVIPETPTPQETKAAEDLAQWLGEMTGAEFPVVGEPTPVQAREISVGDTTRLRASGWFRGRDLGDEGYGIGVVGESLFLVGGRKRGPINAVYAFLEEDLGCRWYTRSVNRIPRRPTVRVRPVPRSYAPVFEIRDPFYRDAFDGTWSLRNRTNAPSAAVPEEWGGRMDYALFVHTFNTLIPPGQYLEEHPEYFMLNEDGKRVSRQLCLTNPDTIRLATDRVLEILRDKPNAEIISVSKNDGGGSCVCDGCSAIDEAEGTHAGSLLHFVNAVAEAVEREHPDKIVSTLAYLETVKPPKTVRPRKNVAIRLCTDRCMWSHPFTPAENSDVFSEALLGWAAIHDRIHIWDYCVNFSHYTAPMPNMDVIAANIRYFAAHNVQGVMEQGAYQSPAAERELMRCWVIGKLLWDPSLDTWDLMQDFIWGYYGAAAPQIVAYNKLLRQTTAEHEASMASPEGGIRYPMDSEFLSPEFLETATALFDLAEQRAGNEEIRHRVELARLPIIYVKLCRGPDFVGEGYGKLIDRFETIARREGLTHIREGPPDVEQKLKQWRDDLRVHGEMSKLNEADLVARPLEATWRFAVDEDDVGVAEKWFTSDHDDARWAELRTDIGTGWESQGFPDYTGVGWYRQSLQPSSELQREHVYLYFAAVDEDAIVYLNGEKVFEHTCSSTGLRPEVIWLTPFAVEVTERLRLGEPNGLVVRVYNRLGMGGIYLPVHLVAADRELDASLIAAALKSGEP